MKKTQPTRNFSEYFWVLKNIMNYYPEICIDVGAGYGTPAIYASFEKSKHVCIEPLEQHMKELSERVAHLEHKIFNFGVLDKPGQSKIKMHKNILTSSLASTDDKDGVDIKVSTVDILMADVDWEGSILMKTDCQGTDLLVLKGAIKTLKRCDVVIVEVSFFRFWGDHQADFYDIVSFMKGQGFVVHDLLDGLFRPHDRALGQIDVAFVKEDGRFRTKRNWA